MKELLKIIWQNEWLPQDIFGGKKWSEEISEYMGKGYGYYGTGWQKKIVYHTTPRTKAGKWVDNLLAPIAFLVLTIYYIIMWPLRIIIYILFIIAALIEILFLFMISIKEFFTCKWGEL